jgi:DNA invertase Pin-like site-specific DNA recombinase
MNKFIIAKYIRLSVDDGITESLSIPHQRMILDKYIDEKLDDIANVEVLEFVDNGFSGTNFERPAVQEMLEMVRSGKINLILTKDFSRYGRNAIETGYFIEQVFPLYGVRFISVSNNFDSNDYKGDTGGIDVQFKFLMHEYYSKDLSLKVSSAFRVKMLRGEHIVARAVYGYQKNSGGKWEPDENVAPIVRTIFQMCLDGKSPAQIRDYLCERKVPAPREYMDLKEGKKIVPKCLWEARAVTRTLTNIQYIGTYVAGKQEQKCIGSHSCKWKDVEEWITIPDHHIPIVSKADFNAVQEVM